MVNAILLSDPAILGVMALDDKGNNLALAVKGEMPERRELSDEFVNKVAAVLSMIKGIVSQYETLYGRFQSFVMNFETSKVVILSIPEIRLAFGLRLLRSANVDYIAATVPSLLHLDANVERSHGGASIEPLSKKPESSRDITP